MAISKDKLNLEQDVTRAIELIQKLQNSEHGLWKSGSINNEKLRNLQQILSSNLFNSVREIYEKLYEKVDINGNLDIQASAAAKATIAVFAASENHSHPRVIELPKTDEGFGFNIMGGREQSSPIYISRIIPGGLAEKNGLLRRGDQLIAVNGVNVEKESHEKTVELLKATNGKVILTVRYTPDILEKIELKFDKQKQLKSNPTNRKY